MKTERRHELQTNELADWLGEHATAFQPYMKTIIGVAILALVGFLALFVIRGQDEGRGQAAWTSFLEAQSMGDADAAKEIARRFPNTAAAPWAWQWAGDYELTQASSDAFVDRAESREGLLEARDAYEAALASQPPALVQRRSTLGLAHVHEALNELDEAERYYQQVADKWPNTHSAKRALDRIAFLQLPETRDFANWFAKQKPRARTAPSQGASGISPPTPFDDLVDESDLSLPDESALEAARSSAAFDSMTPPEAQPAPQPESEPQPDDLDFESGDATSESDSEMPSQMSETQTAAPEADSAEDNESAAETEDAAPVTEGASIEEETAEATESMEASDNEASSRDNPVRENPIRAESEATETEPGDEPSEGSRPDDDETEQPQG